MPLDGHTYLVAQGWSGSGSGLRAGAMSRPLAIPQKRTLAGLGKDRDEAFPFWDHLYAAAAKSIKLRADYSDSDAEDATERPSATINVDRTRTGIPSNRRPKTGTPATTSGTTTPYTDTDACPSIPQVSLMSMAKREAAKRGLYSMFFRGPILGPDDGFEIVEEFQETITIAAGKSGVSVEDRLVVKETRRKKKRKAGDALEKEAKGKRKKRQNDIAGSEKGFAQIGEVELNVETNDSVEKVLTKDDKREKKERKEERKRLKRLKAAFAQLNPPRSSANDPGRISSGDDKRSSRRKDDDTSSSTSSKRKQSVLL